MPPASDSGRSVVGRRIEQGYVVAPRHVFPSKAPRRQKLVQEPRLPSVLSRRSLADEPREICFERSLTIAEKQRSEQFEIQTFVLQRELQMLGDGLSGGIGGAKNDDVPARLVVFAAPSSRRQK